MEEIQNTASNTSANGEEIVEEQKIAAKDATAEGETDKKIKKKTQSPAQDKPKARRKSTKKAEATQTEPEEKAVAANESVCEEYEEEKVESVITDNTELPLTSQQLNSLDTEQTEKENDSSAFPDSNKHQSSDDAHESIEDVRFFDVNDDGATDEFGNEIIIETDIWDDEIDDTITPPDQLFADRAKITEESEIATAEVEDLENDEMIAIDESVSLEENVDDDGQYHFSDLEPIPTPNKPSSAPTVEKYDPKKPRKIDKRFDFVELFVFTLLAIMIITTFFFRHSIVDGASMENTLHSGEHLIISDFFYTPKQGDIIVCEVYTEDIKKPIVKRVIAIEGDTIRVTAEGKVYVNDKPLDESEYVYLDGEDHTPAVDEFEIPKDMIFVMGDHRNVSEDSRTPTIGLISEDAVLGKVILRFYPFDKFGFVN